jgi:Mg-chelatase subunit ChlD
VTPEPERPDRFRFLASFLAGRTLGVGTAAAGEAAYTDGRLVFVSAGRGAPEQRRETLVQAALLGSGSLDPRRVRALRGRPKLARRYLSLEGRRVLAELAARIPLAAALRPSGEPTTSTADESLEVARGRSRVAPPPEWFGVIRPSLLLSAPSGPGATASDRDLRLQIHETDLPESEDGGDAERGAESKILRLLGSPLSSNTLADLFNRLFGNSRSPGDGAAGGELPVRSLRRVDGVGPNARPLPVPLRLTTDRAPGAAIGAGGALYPEWDVHRRRYRPEWCRVIDFPLTSALPDVSAAGVEHDEVLRRRLTRLGLGPKVLRRQPDGDDLDVEALIDLFVDLRAGHSPPEHVYLERRKLARNLGVLILVDASGSATDSDRAGQSVHDRQRRAAATLAATLEELGDRVAIYGFRSLGRAAVQLPAIKPFGQRFGAVSRARLDRLQAVGYTRLGAGIRGAGAILAAEAGTPNRLLLVLSDGFPYDDGYEGRYAEADARKALEELRADGIACLCLSIGASTPIDALQRVFGSASHASAPTLAELSPRMDELFLAALRELAAPSLRGLRRTRP